LKWRLQTYFLLLHSAAIDLQEAKDSIDEEDPRPTSSTWSYTNVDLMTTFGQGQLSRSFTIKYLLVDTDTSYFALIDKKTLNELRAIVSMRIRK